MKTGINLHFLLNLHGQIGRRKEDGMAGRGLKGRGQKRKTVFDCRWKQPDASLYLIPVCCGAWCRVLSS